MDGKPAGGGKVLGILAICLSLFVGLLALYFGYSNYVAPKETPAPVAAAQKIELSGSKVSLSGDGGSIDLSGLISAEVKKQISALTPVASTNVYNQTTQQTVQNITQNSTTVVQGQADGDNQQLSLVGKVLSISGGNSVTLPTDASTDDDPIIGNEVTNITTNGGLLRAGAGSAVDPYTLGLQSCANNEILKSNGSNVWACSSDAGGVSYTAGAGLQLSGSQFLLDLGHANTWTALQTFNAGATVGAGQTFTFNGDAFTDLTGAGLSISGGALQATLGTSIDLTTEVTGVLPVANGGTNLNALGAADQLLGVNGGGTALSYRSLGSMLSAGTGLSLSGTTYSLNLNNANTWTALQTFGAGATISAGQTFTLNGDAFTDLTGTGLTISGGALQSTLGTSIDLTTEVSGILPIANGGTNLNALGAADQLLGVNGGGTALSYRSLGSMLSAGSGLSLAGTTYSLNLSSANTWAALQTFSAGATVSAGQTLTVNGDAFTDLTGTGLTISGGALQTTLGTSIDLTTEVTGVLPVANGGTNLNAIGTADQLLGVNAGATALVYKNLGSLLTAGTGISLSGTTTVQITATGSGGACSVSSTYVCTGGNTLGAALDLGTTDAQGLNILVGGTSALAFASTGSATFKATNSATAFRVVNGSSVPSFIVDTTNNRVYIGDSTGDTTGALLVLDTKTDAGDPTGVNGGTYYNSSLGKFRCFEAGAWRDCSFNARTAYLYSNDLLSVSTSAANNTEFAITQNVNGTGAVNDTVTGEAGRPGIVRQSTGTATTGRAGLSVDTTLSASMDQLLLGNGVIMGYETAVRITTLSDGTDTFTYNAGFIDATNGDSVDGCYFRYADNVNSGKWQGVCRSNSSETVCDTTITAAITTWYRLNIVVNSDGTSADFKTDGVSRCQVASNIPTAAGRQTGFGNVVRKQAGTTNRTVDVDYMEVIGSFTTSR